ncbi:MAG TPA: hypothetical protein VFV50_01725, partial [Bdellovibrionales bacterium]|nr:hypothetical protein [Bdellovibrionales bacterium]
MSARKPGARGFSMIEVLIAGALGVAVMIGLAQWLSTNRAQNKTFTQTVECQSFIDNLSAIFRGNETSKRIRNWIPTELGRLRAPGDTMDHAQITGGSSQVDPEKLLNSQNILSTTTWAMHLYNSHTPAICTGNTGKIFRGEELAGFLKGLELLTYGGERPPGLEEIRVLLKPWYFNPDEANAADAP